MTVKLKQEFDWAFVLRGGDDIPTKQEKFKPIKGYIGKVKKDNQTISYGDIYIRKPDKQGNIDFAANLKELLFKSRNADHPIKHPKKLDIVISISTKERRFFEVDVDNLAKMVLDCLKGIIFEDDSQVVNLLVSKYVHLNKEPSLTIAIKSLKTDPKAFLRILKYSMLI